MEKQSKPRRSPYNAPGQKPRAYSGFRPRSDSRRPSTRPAFRPIEKRASVQASLDPIYPMRINKYLALKGYATRRGADDLIAKKWVFVNGEAAVIGRKIWESDVVEVRSSEKPKTYAYFAYNKPLYANTSFPEIKKEEDKKYIGRRDASRKGSAGESLPRDMFPVGQLDKNSHGLVILTNDGRITDRLLNPEYAHGKEYFVRTAKRIRANFKEKMEGGVSIEGYITKPCVVTVKNDFEFSIELVEGIRNQIRRMCMVLYNDVVNLKRARILNVKIGTLASGAYRPIAGEELKAFLKELGL